MSRLVSQDWLRQLAEKFRQATRPQRRIAYRYRPTLERLEGREMMAVDLAVIDDGDPHPNYVESGSFTATLDDDDASYYSESQALSPVMLDDDLEQSTASHFTRTPGRADVTIDNDASLGSPTYAESGSWTNSSLGGINGGTSRYALTSTSSASSTFTGMASGLYTLMVTTPPHSNSTVAKYTVTYGSETLGTFTHDQRTSSGDFTSLGTFTLSGSSGATNTLTVTLTRNQSTGTLRADAVRLLAPGWAQSGLGGNDGDSVYAYRAGEWANFNFTGLTAGKKELFVRTPPHSNSTTSAVYTVTSGSTTLLTQSQNQQTTTGDWQSLGTFTLSGTSLDVKITNGSSTGVLRADGVEIRDANAWVDTSLAANGSDSRVANGPVASADYTFENVPAQSMTVRVKLPASSDSTSQARYTVKQGTTTLGTFDFDQRTATGNWQTLGVVDVAGLDPATITVTVAHGPSSNGGLLRADGLQLVGDGWQDGPAGFQDDSRYTGHGWAKYSFTGLNSGDEYEIAVNTPGDSGSTAHAIYEVYSGGQLFSTIQPEDQTTPTAGWKIIAAAVAVRQGATDLVVKVLNKADSTGTLRTDAVQITRVAKYVPGDEPTAPPCPVGCSPAWLNPSGGSNTGEVVGYSSNLNPHPIVRVDATLPTGPATPDLITAELIFDGVSQGTTYYDAAGFNPGDSFIVAMQADATGLASGQYGWRMHVTYHYGATTEEEKFVGVQDVVSRIDSEFGRGWSLPELDRLDIRTDGVSLIAGTNAAIWFRQEDTSYIREAGDLSFSNLVKNANGSYTLTSADGLRREFSAAGLLTSRVDPLGNTRSYTYTDGDGDAAVDEIATITDHVGRVTTFAYSAGRVAAITEFDGKVTSFTYDANGRVTTVTENDPDGAGPLAAPVTTYEYHATTGLLTRVVDPRGEETLIAYDHARKVSSIVQSCGGVSEYTTFRSLGVVDRSVIGYDAAHPAPLVAASSMETRLEEHDNPTQVVRDRYGNVVKEIDALGRVTTLERNADGLVTKITQTDPDGSGPLGALVTQMQYDARGNLVQRTNADLTTESWTYDATFSRLTSYTDPLGRQTFWQVDNATGLVLSMTQVVGLVDNGVNLQTDDVTTVYTYTDGLGVAPPGLVETMTDALGVVTSYAYNAHGLVVSITLATGTADETTTTFEYDSSDNLAAVVDGLGRRTEYAYDGLDRLVTTTLPRPSPLAPHPVYTFAYDADGNRTHQTDPLGNITVYVYDERGRLVEVISPDPDGAGPLASPVTTYDFDCVSNLVGISDALGRTTEYEYDELNRLVNSILPDPDGAGPLAAPEVSQSYNAVGWLASETDALGNVTLYAYDAMGRVLSITQPDPDGAGPLAAPVTSFSYDVAGQLLTITDPLGRVTTYAYDDLGRIVTFTQPDPDGAGPLAAPVTSYQYDKLGNLLAITDPLGNLTAYAYDNLYRLVTLTEADPDGAGPQTSPITTYVYDAASQLLSMTDPLGNVTTYAYDDLGRQTSITQADPDGAGPLVAAVTSFGYDAVGNLLTLTDALDNVTEHEYDNLYRLLGETIIVDSTAVTRSYAYDVVGNLIEKTDRQGRVTQLDYDDLDRRTEERWYNGSASPGNLANTVVSSYDVGSRLTSIADDFSSYGYGYDALNRVTSVDNSGTPGVAPVVLTTAYDARGNRASLAANIAAVDDFFSSYAYDGRDLLTSVTQTGQAGGNAVAYKRVELAYDAASRFSSIDRYASAGTGDLVASTAYNYDDAHRLTSLVHAQGATTLAGCSWQFDTAGRVTQFVSNDGTVDYSYDDTNQLTGADYTGYGSDENYSYDENGNRTNAGYSSGDQNRLESDGTHNYLYDAHGNRIRRTHIVNDTVTVYGWDVRNRMVSVTEYASTADADSQANPTQRVEYTYDVYNRKIAKTVDADGDSDVDLRERYVWSDHDANIVLDFTDANLDGFAAADELARRYLWGPAVDQLFAQENVVSLVTAAPEDVFWTLADNLGSIRDLAVYDDVTNSTTVAQHYIYASFGQILAGETTFSRYLYTAQEYEGQTGLYDYNARPYDPDTGQFIAPDFISDNLNNSYAYVANSSTNATDPNGLQQQSASPEVEQRRNSLLPAFAAPFQSPPSKASQVKGLSLFPPATRSNVLPANYSARTGGKFYEAKQGRHVVVNKSDMGFFDVVGTQGVNPCMGVIIEEPGPAGRIFAFHFQATDDVSDAIAGYTYAKNSKVVVFGGDDKHDSRIALRYVLSTLKAEAMKGRLCPAQYNNSIGLWATPSGTFQTFSGEQR